MTEIILFWGFKIALIYVYKFYKQAPFRFHGHGKLKKYFKEILNPKKGLYPTYVQRK